MAKPFESRIQDLVYNVDVGIGLHMTKFLLYVIFVLLVMLIYTGKQFADRGLNDAEAMELSQLARNIALTGKMQTQTVRPLSMWYLEQYSPKKDPRLTDHPDILHPPLYPAALAAAFKVTRTKFDTTKDERIYHLEKWVIVPFAHLLTILTGILVYLLAGRLFNKPIPLLATTIFFLSDSVWKMSISGLGITMLTLIVTGTFYATFSAVHRLRHGAPVRSWLPPVILALLLCVAAFLTRYGAVVLVLPLAIIISRPFKERWWVALLSFVVAFVLCISPWLVRNKIVSGGLMGLTPTLALVDTTNFSGDALPRALHPNVPSIHKVQALTGKWIKNFREGYDGSFRTVGDGLLVCMFLTALFYRFSRWEVNGLRWAVFFSMAGLLCVAPLYGETTMRLMHMFWPIIIIYGLAFFFLLLERLRLPIRLFNMAIITIFVFLAAVPLCLSLVSSRVGTPYPPYFPPYIKHVTGLLKPSELICTDMPWATSWYGNRNSLLLPTNVDEFYEINDFYKSPVKCIYFTTLTRAKPYATQLLTGSDSSWFNILEGRIPGDFPVPHGVFRHGKDQLILVDRMRWLEDR